MSLFSSKAKTEPEESEEEKKPKKDRFSFSKVNAELSKKINELKSTPKEDRKQFWRDKWQDAKDEFNYRMDVYVKEPSEDKGQLFKIEKITSSWFILIPLSVLIFFLVFWLVNWIFGSFTRLFTMGELAMNGQIGWGKVVGLGNCFRLSVWSLFGILVGIVVQMKFIWDLRTNYKDTNIGQKGTSRWTTLREIQQQYKAIPYRAAHNEHLEDDDYCEDDWEVQDYYSGGGGVPICEYKDKIYIDESPVNNLIIGITRSGKGEMFVFPMIDIYSRAGLELDDKGRPKYTEDKDEDGNPKRYPKYHKDGTPVLDKDGNPVTVRRKHPVVNKNKQASIVATDPKLELYANSFDTLTKRGYEVCCLNLVEPLKSMGYNPLQMIIDAYKQENYDEAEMLANTFAYSIFNPGAGGGNDKFWSTESANLLVALILAHIDDCLKEDQYFNVLRLKEFRDKQVLWDEMDRDEQRDIYQQIAEVGKQAKRAKEFWEKRRERDPHINANKPQEAYDAILRDFNQNGIYELDAIPPECEFTPTDKYERMITMYSIVNTFTELGRLTSDDGSSALDDYFAVRPVGDRGKLKYSAIEVAGDQTKGSIFASCLAELTIFTYNDIAKMTSRTEFDLADVGFGDKPMAIFLGIPDYDQSNHFIASVFIRQLYFILAKRATQAGGKCKREVIFLLDEFGNLPAIEGMASIITVCLGRNIRFDLVIQSYAQVEKLYDKDADTIIGNCGNKIYILTNDNQTAENYSQSLGNKTITTISRSGGKLSTNKSFTESQEERPLLNPNELMQLQQGECVVTRTMKRTDKAYNNVAPTPIFNHGDTVFKYRYQYLANDFTDGKTVDDIDYDETVENTRMENITFDIHHFCSSVMGPYIPATRKNSSGEQEDNPEYQKYVDLVKDAHGEDYVTRHMPEEVKKKKLRELSSHKRRQVHDIMAPYVPGMQADDPLFQQYSFDDCLWKTYLAYRKGTLTDHWDDDPEDVEDEDRQKEIFWEKFDGLNQIFDSVNQQERQAMLKSFTQMDSVIEGINAEILDKELPKEQYAG